MNKRIVTPLIALMLVLSIGMAALADTIRLKDGSVIRGQVVGFKDQQFTVLVGAGSRGRRSQITLYMEDVESIEFDSAGGAPLTADNTGQQSSRPSQPATTTTSRPPQQQPVITPQDNTATDADNTASQPAGRPSSSQGAPTFFQINTRVRGDNASNGWTNSGLVVRRGQRIRISATGRVTLGAGRVSTPAGVPAILDNEKLMRSYPTGALIAVIGDDNDDFIFIGGRREFIAQRDGVLFLGVNEGNLNDNTGAYDIVVEAEAMGGGR
jgi:hypothetical protein